MVDPVDMIVPLLHETRAENAAQHEETRGLIKALDKRLGTIEGAQSSYRRALSKLVTGESAERIGTLERKVRDLESRK